MFYTKSLISVVGPVTSAPWRLCRGPCHQGEGEASWLAAGVQCHLTRWPGLCKEEAALPAQCLFHSATEMGTQMGTEGPSTRGRTQGLARPLGDLCWPEGLRYGQQGPRAPALLSTCWLMGTGTSQVPPALAIAPEGVRGAGKGREGWGLGGRLPGQ